MYLDFYKLKKNPFHITPDPEFLFLSASHKEASASLIYGIEERKGFIAITGEIGVGKTTILRSYLETADPEKLKVVYIFNAMISFESLLKQIFNELGLAAAQGDDVPELVNRLHRFLIEEYKHDRNVALIIDEAQNMPIETLENLRMLSNLETSKDKLVQIVMVGQPEFERKLELEELRQLKQRIAIRCQIKPLNREESFAYIQHRLMKGSYFHNQIFTKGAFNSIVKEARGFPRLINILCDNALVTGFGYQRNPVGERVVREVISDFRGPKSRKLFRVLPVAAVFGGIILLGVFLTQPIENRPEKEASLIPHEAEVKLTCLILSRRNLAIPPFRSTSQPPGAAASSPNPNLLKNNKFSGSNLPKNAQFRLEPSKEQRFPECPIFKEAPVAELKPSKEIESPPESRESHQIPLPEKQLPAEESASKAQRRSNKTTRDHAPPPPDQPKQTGAARRIVSKGKMFHVSWWILRLLDPDLMRLYKEANPHIRDVNGIASIRQGTSTASVGSAKIAHQIVSEFEPAARSARKRAQFFRTARPPLSCSRPRCLWPYAAAMQQHSVIMEVLCVRVISATQSAPPISPLHGAISFI